MLALKQVADRGEDSVPPSSSSTRASSSLTRESLARDAAAPTMRESKTHAAGDVLDGRYVLIEQLGKGGMGVVWKASSAALGVEVAVKLVRSSPTPSSDAFKRMAREAHAAARLGHPAMATVLDFGSTADGDPYVVMELLHGESLGDLLGRERRMEAVRAVGTLLPIMDCLREAHDKGIVHRDIKPENIFISKTARGRLQPKVLDFGIAKLEQTADSPNSKLTQDGAVLGSPGYFSPEQARGETDIDLRSDIWSVCVVLYELITGEMPFNGANYNALLMSILKDTPKSLMAHGFGDEALWRIVQRGLMRDRQKRWASMWELGRALAGWLYDQGVMADVTSRSVKEVWLDARSASEQAPSPTAFGNEGPRRRVLSTIKRRVADTLQGETISTLIAQRRLPTRALGWGAATAGVGAILWSVLAQSGGTAAPVAHAAAAPSVPHAALAEAPAPLPAPAPSAAVAAPLAAAPARPAPPPAAATPRAVRTAPDKKAAAPKATLVSTRTAAVAANASASVRARAPETPVKSSSRPALAPKAKAGASASRKGIDQEFGF
jgi:serine/threonine protein kinase